MRHIFVGLVFFATACLRAQSFTVVASFDGTKDYLPRAMVQGPDGGYYGVGGWFFLSTPGMVFKVTPDGMVSTLYTFCSQPACADGSFPNALILGSDGNFYGTTTSGGSGVDSKSGDLTGNGTVFKITPAGVFTTIYTFQGMDGASPSGTFRVRMAIFMGPQPLREHNRRHEHASPYAQPACCHDQRGAFEAESVLFDYK